MKRIKSFQLFESLDKVLPVGTKLRFSGKDCQIVSHKSTINNEIYYLIRYLDGSEEFIVPKDKRIEIISPVYERSLICTNMKKIKSFYLFESSEDINLITSTVKDMLLELDFLDIETRVDIVKNHSKLQVDEKSPEIIVINLWKKAIKKEDYGFKASYVWSDIQDVVMPIMDYLESEGFIWKRDEGTLSSGGIPIISTSGSMQFDTVRSKVEMWFIR